MLASVVKLAYIEWNEKTHQEGGLNRETALALTGYRIKGRKYYLPSLPPSQVKPFNGRSNSVPSVGSCGCPSVSLAGNAGQTHYLAPPSRVWSVDDPVMAEDYTQTRRCRQSMSSLGWLKNRLYMHRLMMTMNYNDLQVVAGDSDTLVMTFRGCNSGGAL